MTIDAGAQFSFSPQGEQQIEQILTRVMAQMRQLEAAANTSTQTLAQGAQKAAAKLTEAEKVAAKVNDKIAALNKEATLSAALASSQQFIEAQKKAQEEAKKLQAALAGPVAPALTQAEIHAKRLREEVAELNDEAAYKKLLAGNREYIQALRRAEAAQAGLNSATSGGLLGQLTGVRQLAGSWTELSSKIGVAQTAIGGFTQGWQQLWSAAKQGARIEDLANQFERMEQIDPFGGKLDEALNGQVSESAKNQIAALGRSLNLTADQIYMITDLSALLAKQTGEDVTKVFERTAQEIKGLTVGENLERFGVNVVEIEATLDSLAKQQGVSRDMLNEQVQLNTILNEAYKNRDVLAAKAGDTELSKLNQLEAKWQNMLDKGFMSVKDALVSSMDFDLGDTKGGRMIQTVLTGGIASVGALGKLFPSESIADVVKIGDAIDEAKDKQALLREEFRKSLGATQQTSESVRGQVEILTEMAEIKGIGKKLDEESAQVLNAHLAHKLKEEHIQHGLTEQQAYLLAQIKDQEAIQRLLTEREAELENIKRREAEAAIKHLDAQLGLKDVLSEQEIIHLEVERSMQRAALAAVEFGKGLGDAKQQALELQYQVQAGLKIIEKGVEKDRKEKEDARKKAEAEAERRRREAEARAREEERLFNLRIQRTAEFKKAWSELGEIISLPVSIVEPSEEEIEAAIDSISARWDEQVNPQRGLERLGKKALKFGVEFVQERVDEGRDVLENSREQTEKHERRMAELEEIREAISRTTDETGSLLDIFSAEDDPFIGKLQQWGDAANTAAERIVSSIADIEAAQGSELKAIKAGFGMTSGVVDAFATNVIESEKARAYVQGGVMIARAAEAVGEGIFGPDPTKFIAAGQFALAATNYFIAAGRSGGSKSSASASGGGGRSTSRPTRDSRLGPADTLNVDGARNRNLAPTINLYVSTLESSRSAGQNIMRSLNALTNRDTGEQINARAISNRPVYQGW